MGRADTLARQFYLTGGTALAAFYLHHRYSEDLDFFSETEFDISGVNVFLASLKNTLKIVKIDFQQSLIGWGNFFGLLTCIPLNIP